jgi:hypothetical protein
MNDVIAKYYMERVATLDWADVTGGLVRAVSVKKPVSGNKTITQTFPVACDITHEDCQSNPDILRLFTPNSTKKAVIYFEDKGVSSGVYNGKNRWMSRLRLVCWMNLNRFENAGCSLSFYAISSMLPLIQTSNPVNYDGIIQAMYNVGISIPAKDANIFSRYTYNEFKQYLLHPFDYFAIDIETVFDVNPSCVPALTTKDEDCP